MSKLVDIYKSLYAAAGMTTTEDGFVNRKILDTVMPFLVDGKRLVLPTLDHQRNPDPKNKVIGHILREKIAKGPSPVLEAFREAMSIRLSITTAMIVYDLIDLAASPAQHAKLNPLQQEYLSVAKNADEEMVKRTMKLLKAVPVNQTQKAFASTYVRWSAKLNNQTFKRGGIISFPIYTELTSNDKEVYGVKLRGKDFETLIATMKFIFPDIDTLNAYSYGSNSDVAPSIDALMGGVLKFVEQIHGVLDLFGDLLPSCKDLYFDLEWMEPFEDLNALLPLIRSVPSQAGNDGASTRQELATEAAAANQEVLSSTPAPAAEKRIVIGQVPVAAPVTPPAPVAAPVYTPEPQAPATGKVDIGQLMRTPAMPVNTGYPMMPPGYGHPGMMPPQGMHPGMGMPMPGMHPGMNPMMNQMPPQFQGGHPGMAPPMGGAYPATMPYPGMTGQFGHGVPFGYNPHAAPLHRY